jgi:hypothetical protein
VAVREAGENAEVFDDVSDNEAEDGEDQDPTETIMLRAMEDGEREGGKNFERDNGGGGIADGKDFEDTSEGVEGEEGGECDGDRKASLLVG